MKWINHASVIIEVKSERQPSRDNSCSESAQLSVQAEVAAHRNIWALEFERALDLETLWPVIRIPLRATSIISLLSPPNFQTKLQLCTVEMENSKLDRTGTDVNCVHTVGMRSMYVWYLIWICRIVKMWYFVRKILIKQVKFLNLWITRSQKPKNILLCYGDTLFEEIVKLGWYECNMFSN